MRNDTKTFLATVFGIPLALGGVWVVNALNESSSIVFEREHDATVESGILQAIEPSEEGTAVATATPIAPAPKLKPATPAVVAPPAVATVVETPPPAPAPKPVVVNNSRRTRAS